MSIQNSLSSTDLAFLEKYYRVLNPTTRQTSTDFSSLLSCKIVLIGEFHHSLIGVQIQTKIAQLFKKSTCLLLEGLAPSLKPFWQSLEMYKGFPSHFHFRGSDIRGFKNTHSYVAFENYKFRLAHAYKARFEEFNRLTAGVAAIFNQALFDNTASIRAGRLILDEGIYTSLINFYAARRDGLNKSEENLLSLIESVDMYADPTPRKKRWRIKESNTFLIKEIKKTAQVYQTVVAIWGSDHFCDPRFEEHFGRAGSDFIVLVPSPEFSELGNREYATQHDKSDLSFPIDCKRKKTDEDGFEEAHGFNCSTLPDLLPHFHPDLQAIFQNPNKMQKIIYDTALLKTAFADTDSIVLDVEKIVVFKGIDLATHLFFDEMVIPAEIDEVFMRLVGESINTILCFGHLSLCSLEMGNFAAFEFAMIDFEPSVAFILNHPAEFTVSRTQLQIEAALFFKEMNRRCLNQFKLNVGASLIFRNFDSQVLQNILHEPEEIAQHLSQYAPPHMTVQVLGTFDLSPMTACENGSLCLGIKAVTDVIFFNASI